MKSFLCALALIMFVALPAQAAAPLTRAQAANFVAAIPDMESLSDKMRKEGKDAVLESTVRPKPGDTDFRPYTKGAEVLKVKFPADYTLLASTVMKHGFTSAEDWAVAGDNVMMAYLATKMEGKDYKALQAMANVPPEVKAKLPPQAAAQMDQALTVMRVVQAVPPANKEIVRPHVPAIDAWLAREQKKYSAQRTAKAPAKAPAQAPAKTTP